MLTSVSTAPLSTLNTLLLFCQGQSAIFFMAWLAGMLALLGLAFRGVVSSRAAAVVALLFLAAPLATGAVAPSLRSWCTTAGISPTWWCCSS